MKVEQIADFGDLCGEGPLWKPSEQCLYWTDLARPRLYRYSPLNNISELVSNRVEVSGFAFNRSSGLVVTNMAGVWLWDDFASEPFLLARQADGRRCCLNDCIADPEGRVYSGSYYRNPVTGIFEAGKGSLFRIDPDGSVHIADEGFRLSNGLGFSPDCSTLYFVDSADRRIYSYDWTRHTGDVRNRRVLVQVPLEEGFPDGMTVDTEGFIWCAHWFSGCVIRYDPDGREERRVALPALQVSSVAFGGSDLSELFVTSAAHLDSVELAPPGFEAGDALIGGPVYRFQSGFQGREEYQANVARPA